MKAFECNTNRNINAGSGCGGNSLQCSGWFKNQDLSVLYVFYFEGLVKFRQYIHRHVSKAYWTVFFAVNNTYKQIIHSFPEQ